MPRRHVPRNPRTGRLITNDPRWVMGQKIGGKSTYYYDTGTKSFYSTRPKDGYARIDLRTLLRNPKTNRSFVIRDDGSVAFKGLDRLGRIRQKGVDIGYNVSDRRIPERLRSPKTFASTPSALTDTEDSYVSAILRTSPGYTLVGVSTSRGKTSATFADDKRRLFIVILP